MMIAWGVVCMSMGFVKNFDGLVAARVFLGLAEGGLFPGLAFLYVHEPRSSNSSREIVEASLKSFNSLVFHSGIGGRNVGFDLQFSSRPPQPQVLLEVF